MSMKSLIDMSAGMSIKSLIDMWWLVGMSSYPPHKSYSLVLYISTLYQFCIFYKKILKKN